MKMNRVCWVVLIIVGFSWFGLAAGSNPQAPKKPVTNEYHGVKVEDDYQWLENDNDPAVKAWSDAQNQKTRAYLDKLPDRRDDRDATNSSGTRKRPRVIPGLCRGQVDCSRLNFSRRNSSRCW